MLNLGECLPDFLQDNDGICMVISTRNIHYFGVRFRTGHLKFWSPPKARRLGTRLHPLVGLIALILYYRTPH